MEEVKTGFQNSTFKIQNPTFKIQKKVVLEATDQDFNEIISSNPKVIVKYFADWCGTCKLFAPKYKRLSSDERFEGVTFIEINAENNPEARKIAGVSNLPFMATFKGGKLAESAATGKEEAVLELLSRL
jgi:thioredoxin 1